MFDKSFDFTYINHQPGGPSDDFLRVHTYKFHSEKELYLVRLEEYPFDVFAIKFYPKSFEDSPNKYRLLTNHGNPMPIIRTCINIMIDILNKFPGASLGFMGIEMENEHIGNTKRYRIYRQLMENFFSPVNFSHHVYIPQSIYLLLNRNSKHDNHLQVVEKFFVDRFVIGPDNKDPSNN